MQTPPCRRCPKLLPPGEAGEGRISGDCVGPGYWRDPAATAAIFTSRGCLSRDIGTLSDDGELTIVDRKKGVIISGGFNICPIEVEDVLYEHPDVALCALIGLPDALRGERPVAIVVRRAGAAADAGVLISHCKSRIAAYKVPREVIFRNELPLGPTGKILKRELLDEFGKRENLRPAAFAAGQRSNRPQMRGLPEPSREPDRSTDRAGSGNTDANPWLKRTTFAIVVQEPPDTTKASHEIPG